MHKALLLALLVMLAAFRASAADPQQVFLTPDGSLSFIDLLTGTQTNLSVSGDHYTVTRDGVMFYDRASRRVMLARADGTVIPHPFIQPGDGVNRVDWHISNDEQTIAWTETSGSTSALTTQTWIAGIDGTNVQLVLTDGPRNGIRAYPVAFSQDKSVLYMDDQPDTIGDLTPFRQYAGLFALNLLTGETNSLPDEPGCFCGGGIGADIFLRLALAPSGFNLHIINLTSGAQTMLAPINNFTQGGDVLIAPDGSRAVYALAQISGFGTAQQSVQTALVLVDLLNLTQSPLGAPVNRLLRPIQWTEDDSAVLLVDPVEESTWKATVSDGTLEKVANAVFLGTLQ